MAPGSGAASPLHWAKPGPPSGPGHDMSETGEYEDRYPDAYGHGEPAVPAGDLAAPAAARRSARPGSERRAAAPLTAPLVRAERDICDDVYERLKESPFIDATGVAVSVTGAEVTLDGTINSLIAVSLARALALNVAGVGAVQVRLKVAPPPRRYETSEEA